MKHLEYGFGLLEVLIAAFILAFGLLGIIGIYVQSFKSIESSYRRTLSIIEEHATHEKTRTTY